LYGLRNVDDGLGEAFDVVQRDKGSLENEILRVVGKFAEELRKVGYVWQKVVRFAVFMLGDLQDLYGGFIASTSAILHQHTGSSFVVLIELVLMYQSSPLRNTFL
jgi:hypothetical protein